MEKFLAARTHEIEWSGIRVMFALAYEIPEVVKDHGAKSQRAVAQILLSGH